MKYQMKENAVSPVIGVLLMLVVVIIIAAVVSAFAGGLSGGEKKAPQLSIVPNEIVVNEAFDSVQSNWAADPVSGKCSDVYVLFEHKGGDPLNLKNCQIWYSTLNYPHETHQVGADYAPNSDVTLTGDKSTITGEFSKSWSNYLESYPEGDNIVTVGDMFVLHADFARGRTGQASAIGWQPDGDLKGIFLSSGDVLTYQIFDQASDKVISSGQIEIPTFSVSDS